MFKPDLCDFCGECLARCHYLDFDEQTGGAAIKALAEGETPEWLNRCITCFACSEFCPKGADPFDLICRRQEERGDYVAPELLAGLYDHFSPKGDFTAPESTRRAVSACTIYNVVPGAFQSPLFADMTLLRGRFYFCNILYMHLGNMSCVKKDLAAVVDRLAATGAEEIVFVHDDCYAMLEMAREAGIALPFRPIHIFGYLAEYLRAHPDQITPIDMAVAYQRPCASRYSPEKEHLLDEIFQAIGARRVNRVFDRTNALCCGQNTANAISARAGQETWIQKNISDAADHQADAMVFLCPMCYQALGDRCKESNMEPYFIVDIVRKALGEHV